MIFAYLAIASNLIFIPGLFDGHELPKKVFVLALGATVLIRSLSLSKASLAKHVVFIIAYLSVSLIDFAWIVNWSLFVERISLDVTFFFLFLYLSRRAFTDREIYTFHALLTLIALFSVLSGWFFLSEKGAMGNYGLTAELAGLGIIAAIILLSELVITRIVCALRRPLDIERGLIVAGLAILSIVAFLWTSASLSVATVGALTTLLLIGLREINKPIIIGIATLTFLLLVLTPALLSQFDKPISRALQWRNLSAMIARNPWGIGAGQFQVVYPLYANAHVRDPEMLEVIEIVSPPDVSYRGQLEHAHNDFVEILGERGIVAFAFFSLLIFQILSSPRHLKSAKLGLYIELLSLLVWGIFWFPLAHPSLGMTFWTIAGLLNSDNAKAQRSLTAQAGP